MPWGLEYFGTHQIPLISGSEATKRSTVSISGPSGVISMGIISKPKHSVMEKCRSYPGTGHKNFRFSQRLQGFAPGRTP